MAGHAYPTKAYSNYDDFPAQDGGYAYGPDRQVNWYVVETRVERVRVPASGYTRYAPMDHHEDYERLYGSDYENSSSPRHSERENLMGNIFNKLRIGVRPPMKTSSLSSPKGPNKFQPTSQNNYRPTSPSKYRPTSPNKYRPTSPNKYYPTSPIKYRPRSPNTYESTSPIKYRPTSPDKYRSNSPNKHQPTSPNNYLTSSPDKYQTTSPSKYPPTSSAYTYPSEEANMTKAQTLPGPNKYRPTSPTKYRSTSPTHNYPSNEDHMNRSPNMSGPMNDRPTSPVHSFPKKEGQPNRTQSLSGPNKNHSSSHGAERGRAAFPIPNNHWQNAGPPTTRRPLMTPTNNIDEALGFLIESYSPRSHPAREGSFDNMYPRAQPTEHERGYMRPAFGGVTNRPYLRSNTIDSHEAVRRYNGAYVP